VLFIGRKGIELPSGWGKKKKKASRRHTGSGAHQKKKKKESRREGKTTLSSDEKRGRRYGGSKGIGDPFSLLVKREKKIPAGRFPVP